MKTNEWKTTKVSPEIHALVKAEAAAAGVPMIDLVEMILCDWIRRQGLPLPNGTALKVHQADLFLVRPPKQ